MPPKSSFNPSRTPASLPNRVVAPIVNRVTSSSQNPVHTIIVALLLTNLLLISAVIAFFMTRMTTDRSNIESAYLQAQIQQIKTSVAKISQQKEAAPELVVPIQPPVEEIAE